jgi:hypothetical protein
MNEIDPQFRPDVKSNYGNAMEWLVNNTAPGSYTSAVNHYRHDLPISLGLTARMELTPRVGVESGLEYTYLHSSVLSEAVQMDQRLHFVGIPVRVDARLWSRDGIDLYAGLGAKAEKCISATMGKIECEEPRLQWFTEAFAGLQYRIPPGPISISSRRFPTVSRRRTSSHTVLKPRWCSRSMQVCVLT